MLNKSSVTPDKEKLLYRITKISGIAWVACIIGVFAILGYVVGIRKEMFDKAPEVFAFSLLGLVLLGCFAFFIGLVSFTSLILVRNSKKTQNKLLFLIKLALILAILPLYLLAYILKPLEFIKRLKRFRLKELLPKQIHLKLLLTSAVALLIVAFVIGYWVAGEMTAYQLGYVPEDMAIVGTGSMYPTWPKGTKGKSPKELAKEVVSTAGFLHYPNGIVISGKRYFGHTLGRGDIITWENDATRALTSQDGAEPAGLLKRLIGLPGDTIELRDGVMYLNGEPQKEPYTAKPHSSFGEKFLKECQVITVPEGKVFAMGDNRKGSADSREIGFAPIIDINYVLPLSKQKGILDKNWRDTSKDLDASSKVRLDKTRYVELLNEKRKDTGAKPLKYQPLLEKSAFKRGEIILKYDDFSYEATRSGYTQIKAMNEVGYSNIAYGEAPTLGYYEAEELMDNQFEFPDTKKFLLNKEFQEVGISEVEEEVNGCPTQVLVQHFAGYVPPNYKTEDIESWKTNLSRLREIQPSWSRLKENNNFYQKNKNDVDRINEIISTRIANISSIIARMESNQWLTATEQRMVNQDKTLYDEQEAVATRLNSQ
ncbi:signal peptidase I [Candidatus Collierbacteria bacterium]|nr:signal peptidase I [Candidatus Collierbacteria bacterium]